MKLLNDLFAFILIVSAKYGIDESHDVSHSMNVLHYAHNIYESQVCICPLLKTYQRVIYIAALLHDMCDKKYMDETEGIQKSMPVPKTKLIKVNPIPVTKLKSLRLAFSQSAKSTEILLAESAWIPPFLLLVVRSLGSPVLGWERDLDDRELAQILDLKIGRSFL